MAKQNKPAIRFKGFTDAWEQRKVGELIEDYIEKTTVQNQYPVLTSSQQQGVVFQEDYFADRQVTTNDNIGYYVLPYGYFTYRSRSDTDVFVFNRNNIIDKGIISYYYPVFLPKDCDSNFLLRRLNHGIKKQLSMAAEGTGQKVLAHNKFKNMIVDVPEIEEQQKIGLYFESLDHLITLHQRKYDKLQVLKKAMLEKMFPKNGSSVPEIRFKGFTDAWEQRKFSELYAKSSEKNDGSIGMDRNITVATMQFKDDVKVSTAEYLKTYYTFNLGDIAFEGHQGKEFRFGRFVENDIGNGIVSHIFSVFRPITEFDLQFWKYAINNEMLMQQILSRSTKASTMMHDLVTDDFLNETFLVPSLDEQKQIGACLYSLDHLITLHQRELEKLQNIKKSMLEKMFV
jgi:type I restriction enzyme S subunit